MVCKVMRPFGGPDNSTLLVGSIVDVSDWPPRNVKSLVERRYLKELEGEMIYAEHQGQDAFDASPAETSRRGPGRPPKPKEE